MFSGEDRLFYLRVFVFEPYTSACRERNLNAVKNSVKNSSIPLRTASMPPFVRKNLVPVPAAGTKQPYRFRKKTPKMLPGETSGRDGSKQRSVRFCNRPQNGGVPHQVCAASNVCLQLRAAPHAAWEATMPPPKSPGLCFQRENTEIHISAAQQRETEDSM